jgi:hypothetical protein
MRPRSRRAAEARKIWVKPSLKADVDSVCNSLHVPMQFLISWASAKYAEAL